MLANVDRPKAPIAGGVPEEFAVVGGAPEYASPRIRRRPTAIRLPIDVLCPAQKLLDGARLGLVEPLQLADLVDPDSLYELACFFAFKRGQAVAVPFTTENPEERRFPDALRSGKDWHIVKLDAWLHG